MQDLGHTIKMSDKILFKRLRTPLKDIMFSSQVLASSSSSSFQSFQYDMTLDLFATLSLCLTIAFCVVLLYQTLFSFLSWLLDVRPDRAAATTDLERAPAEINDTDYTPHQAAFDRALVQHNVVQLVDLLERFVRDIDERRGQRLRALNRLPPLISYGSHERRWSSSGRVDECVICLEDFKEGESCQVLPFCNHIFHTDCIDHWFKNRPTCPVCRHCILDV